MFPLHPDLCPYTLNSLKFFLLAPLYDNFPIFVSIVIFLVVPNVAINYLTHHAYNHIKLVKHSPIANHPHSPETSLAIIARSVLLGILFSLGLRFAFHATECLTPLGIYLSLLALFHFSEYFVTSLTNPATLNPGSFLLYHSPAYVFAIIASFLEYSLECYLFPSFKRFNTLAIFGLSLCVIGESVRKLAMFTAGENFSHLIRSTKSPYHNLVTHGIYSHFRHPSYAGWFYWAIGSQILMLNPVCTILFAVISYKFFKSRIAYEEQTLIEFFGPQYLDYKEKVGLWMPIWDLTLENDDEEEEDGGFDEKAFSTRNGIVDLRKGLDISQAIKET